MTLTVIATLKARTGQEQALSESLRGLVEPTHREEGCLKYEMHLSHENPGHVIFVESWASRPLWEAHMESPHLKAFSAMQDELVESWDLFVGEKTAG
ncbi:antibiotic biosynthesis monooxygenase [Meridianimarinicoccus roseus]|uniref:Antibiotic biosynthesis monooxygenase n=1 Tax=Meridianimarinicoccus roseus TaxID=2072018 RepID=A0A2V2LEZ3_9RHOB|nr:putative quinol monooxygenase [Meridianimarinicoccus roseus]PWR02064.1 antibiotic biosynthesis monooxygenase [Meridianimarinicoccus roseus]